MTTRIRSWLTRDSFASATHIIIMTEAQEVLLLRRTGYDYGGHWGLPGGGIEPGETSQEALIREMAEEIGVDLTMFPEAVEAMQQVTVREGSVTWALVITEPFEPILNREHDAYQWADATELPEPMHPNAAAVIQHYLNKSST